MKCLTYAVSEWVRRVKAGAEPYMFMRPTRCKWIKKICKYFPHFGVAERVEGVSHMTQNKPDKNLRSALWNILTGRNYKHKRGDE